MVHLSPVYRIIAAAETSDSGRKPLPHPAIYCVRITVYETRAELKADKAFIERFEHIRRIAGEKIGLGDVRDSVIPKFAIVAPPRRDGHFTSRYFTPWNDSFAP